MSLVVELSSDKRLAMISWFAHNISEAELDLALKKVEAEIENTVVQYLNDCTLLGHMWRNVASKLTDAIEGYPEISVGELAEVRELIDDELNKTLQIFDKAARHAELKLQSDKLQGAVADFEIANHELRNFRKWLDCLPASDNRAAIDRDALHASKTLTDDEILAAFKNA